MKTQDDRYALILVGGKGTRLWPMSRENHPKQFVEFKNGRSLFQLTVQRILSSVKPAHVAIVAGDRYKFTIYNQLEQIKGLTSRDINALKANLVLEPAAKNTLPAIALGVSHFRDERGLKDDDVVYVFPSDHIIEPVSACNSSLQRAVYAARHSHIVTFGVPPTHPKEGYGYIIPGEALSGRGKVHALTIERFVEKPLRDKAEELIKNGAFWNSGIFCFTRRTFEQEMTAHQPELFGLYAAGHREFLGKFSQAQAESIDYGIMQKTTRAAVVRFEPRWSDLGSWDSLMDFYSDGSRNLSVGKSAELKDCRDCMVYAGDRQVAMIGIKDAIVVDSPDALLIVKRGESDSVKEVVSRLEKKGVAEVKDSTTVFRPWGYYKVLEDRPGYKVKEIGVYAGKAISMQKHKHRSEHWNIVEGKAYIIVGNLRMEVGKNESAYVPKNTRHKFCNESGKLVKMIEVQIGDYLEEDDIVRYDSYE